jgi:hypothetical protein
MRVIPLCLLALAACNPTNSLSGPFAFDVQNAGAALIYDGGVATSVHIYIWGGVDGGGEPATVCNEVTPTGPISSATVTNLVALNLTGPTTGLDTGSYLVTAQADAGTNLATIIVALGANGDQPNALYFGTSGTVSLSSIGSTQLIGTFQVNLAPLGGNADGGPLSGTFAATPCTP